MSDFLLETLLRSALLGAVAISVIGLLRKQSASLRHALAAEFVLVILALPFLALLVHRSTAPSLPAMPVRLHLWLAQSAPLVAGIAVAPAGGRSSLPITIGSLALWIWAVGAGILLLRIVLGLAVTGRWLRRSERVRGNIVQSPKTHVPLTFWLGRHRVVLPLHWRDWSRAELRSVIGHEFAHIRRGDWFTQLFASIACALLWPNPFIWKLSRELRRLAEHAADDLVISSGVTPSRYAEHLLEIAREAHATTPVLALSMAAKADVARRIEMILKPNQRRGAASLAALVTGGFVLTALSAPIATWAIGSGQKPASVTILATILNMKPKDFAGKAELTQGDLPSKPQPFALWMSTADAEASIKKSKKFVLSSPNIQTYSGLPASISLSTKDNGKTKTTELSFTPVIKGSSVSSSLSFSMPGQNGDVRRSLGTTFTKDKSLMVIMEDKIVIVRMSITPATKE